MDCVMIILNYNDSRRALQLAEKCLLYPAIDKVIVVDNKSTDDSLDYLKQNMSKEIEMLVAKENKGFAAGNNIGARFAIEKYAPRYLLFANTDTIFENEDVQACQQQIEKNEKLGLVSIRMKDIYGVEERDAWKYKSFTEYFFSFFWLYRHHTYMSDRYEYNDKTELLIVDNVRGSFMLFRAEALCSVDYFDESTFLYYEEECISHRLKSKGYLVGIITDRFYVHNHIYAKNSNLKSKRIMDASLLYFLREYYRIGKIKECMIRLASNYSYAETCVIEQIKKRRIDSNCRNI